jgi:hypothetical protein
MSDILDYPFYCKSWLKIKTKTQGLQPLYLRDYQLRFYKFVEKIMKEGPARVIVLKPRQAGFSTCCASLFHHLMVTTDYFRMLAMADKFARTESIRDIYATFLQELPGAITPMVAKNNQNEILYDNPVMMHRKVDPGIGSGVVFETAQDPNAGRSTSRKGAHLSETAFYPYYKEIDEGIQNSIPLVAGSLIIKESTANGKAGTGKPFFDLWSAAKAKDSIYKAFFVAWYEIEDYSLPVPKGFKATSIEKEMLEKYPQLTKANLVWRRLKILEYLDDEEEAYLSPDQRFSQDFPVTDRDAFLSTGLPVFDQLITEKIANRIKRSNPQEYQDKVELKSFIFDNYMHGFKMWTLPRQGVQYFIGADVSEGLASGDASSLFVCDENRRQVARWHGKIDADLFGHLLMAIGYMFNTAIINCENNNMGHTTVTTMRNEGYPRQFKEMVEDKITKETRTKYGWTTTKKSKNDMINEACKQLRDETAKIYDIDLIRQMDTVARGENGEINLNGKDRVVAFCLAMMCRKLYLRKETKRYANKTNMETGTAEEIRKSFERANKVKDNDFFG